MAVSGWIEGDESAKEMVGRVLTERPLLLLPPLHRVPLRVGNVVEIVGPSHSAKTHILIQAAVSCILPKEWNGVNYGGLERLVMFFDLDCRFDILRLSQLLRHRIIKANGSSWEQNGVNVANCNSKDANIAYDEELFALCMRRFLYIRCYDSLEFLATLKTLHYQLRKQREIHGVGVHFLMIDSIGAFYWVDRASTSLQLGGNNRKILSLQTVSETVVQEIQKLLLMHPMLVLATKVVNLGDKYMSNEVKIRMRWKHGRTWEWTRHVGSFENVLKIVSAPRKWFSENASDLSTTRSSPQNLSYRECMPSVWQSFVTHRVLVRASDDDSNHQAHQIYLSKWLLPSLSLSDRFTVGDAGVFIMS